MNNVLRLPTGARTLLLASALVAALSTAAQAGGPPQLTAHSKFAIATKVTEVSSEFADGCPIESADGLSLFIASNRTGTAGANDIWASDRDSLTSPWGTPRNLG